MTDSAPAHRPTTAAIIAAMTPFFGVPLGVLVFAFTRPSLDEGMMNALAEGWAEGGWPMYLVLASTALVGLGSAVLLFFGVQQGSSAVLAIAPLSSLASAAGVAGAVIGMRAMNDVLGLVNPADRATILAAGTGEALNASAFGFACAAGGLFASAGGALLGSLAQRAEARRLLFVASVTLGVLGLVMGASLVRSSEAGELLRAVAHAAPMDRVSLLVAGSEELAAHRVPFLGLVVLLLAVLAVGAVVLKTSPRVAVVLPVLGLGGLLGPGLAATANALATRQPTGLSTVTRGVLVELPGNDATAHSAFWLGKNSVSKGDDSGPTEPLRITGDPDRQTVETAVEAWAVNATDKRTKDRQVGLHEGRRQPPLGLAVEVLADAPAWWAFVTAALRAEVVELELIGEAQPVSVKVAPELAALAEALKVTRRSVPLTLSLEPVGTTAEVSGDSLLVDGQTWTAAALTSRPEEQTTPVSIRADLSMRPQTVVMLALAAASHQRRLNLIVPSGARPPPPPDQPHDPGEGLAQAAIKQVVMRHVAEVRACYERELKHRPGLEGRVVVGFSIGLDGRVGDLEVEETLPDDDAVADCVATRVKTWRFPKPTGGEPIEVRYPFVFTPAD
jgi:hypothetical protein